jgi:hypothetical protein
MPGAMGLFPTVTSARGSGEECSYQPPIPHPVPVLQLPLGWGARRGGCEQLDFCHPFAVCAWGVFAGDYGCGASCGSEYLGLGVDRRWWWADDRLALEFVLQVCANPRMRGMVVRITLGRR